MHQIYHTNLVLRILFTFLEIWECPRIDALRACCICSTQRCACHGFRLNKSEYLIMNHEDSFSVWNVFGYSWRLLRVGRWHVLTTALSLAERLSRTTRVSTTIDDCGVGDNIRLHSRCFHLTSPNKKLEKILPCPWRFDSLMMRVQEMSKSSSLWYFVFIYK